MDGSWTSNPRKWKAWIGGTAETNPEAYRSRGGLTTVGNLLTPILVFHGENDIRVPVLHARLWVGAAHGQGRGGLVTYHELTGVGDRTHFGNETAEGRAWRLRRGEEFLAQHREPVKLPERGSFVVAGYLKTSRFEVILDSIDRVGRVDYDLPAGKFDVSAATARKATVRSLGTDGKWTEREVECRKSQ